MIHLPTHFLRVAVLWTAASAALLAAEPAAGPTPPAQPAAAPATPKFPLHQIIIGDSMEAAQQIAPVPNGPFVVTAPALSSALDLTELAKRLAGGQNQMIDEKLVTIVGDVIANFARQQKFPHAVIAIPNQNIGAGTLRFALLLTPPLIHHVVVSTEEEEASHAAPTVKNGFLVVSPALSFIKHDELAKRLAQAEDQPFQEKLVAAIAQVVETYLQQNDYPLAKAIVPRQDPASGLLHVTVQLGKIRNIRVAGNRWFSESLLREKLRLEKGETLRISELDRAVSWTNNNPYRRVHVHIQPVGTGGEGDVIVAVQEALPLRAIFTYDNDGNEAIGRNRFAATLSYANLWGLDHSASYQFLTTDKGLHTIQSHSIDYRMPLPWRDYLMISASYLQAQPTILDGLLTQKGENVSSTMRYTHPLRTGDNPAEIFAGVEFKRSNNNLLWLNLDNTTTPVETTRTDVFQFNVGGSMVKRDKQGAWAFGATVNVSPGGIDSYNKDEAYQATRALARPYYLYGQLTFQRLLNLQHGWDFTTRGILQAANANLLPSEQFYIGGSNTVRGYHENVFGGDHGFLLTNELTTPLWKHALPYLPKNRNVLEGRLVAFYDAGQVHTRHPTPVDSPSAPLASTGIGIRLNLANNFALSGDYGWQITHLPYAHEDHGRGTIRVTIGF